MTFRDLKIGQHFDWIDDSNPSKNSFFYRCVKTSPRTYGTNPGNGMSYRVGTINAVVYHVDSL